MRAATTLTGGKGFESSASDFTSFFSFSSKGRGDFASPFVCSSSVDGEGSTGGCWLPYNARYVTYKSASTYFAFECGICGPTGQVTIFLSPMNETHHFEENIYNDTECG